MVVVDNRFFLFECEMQMDFDILNWRSFFLDDINSKSPNNITNKIPLNCHLQFLFRRAKFFFKIQSHLFDSIFFIKNFNKFLKLFLVQN